MKYRIDRIFSDSNIMSRSETKAAARHGRICVNGVTVTSADSKADENDIITLDGVQVNRHEFFYFMMNKPAGYVCSTDDPKSKTVLDLLSKADRHPEIFPAGRLDKDTVGFVFLTNDGALAHSLLSPVKHIEKTYRFVCEKPLTADDTPVLESGIMMDGKLTKPAKLTVDSGAVSGSITLTEGKYHQIKRMFESVGNRITSLKRVTYGGIPLDPALPEGGYRPLSDSEISLLKEHGKP